MMKRLLIFVTPFLLSTALAHGQAVKAEKIRVGGWLGQKIGQCIQYRVMDEDVVQLTAPFFHHEETGQWQTEFWGKWMLGAVEAYRYAPDPRLRDKMERSVRQMLSAQLPDGYIGNYSAGSQTMQWDIWGRKYTAMGLLAWYDLTGDRKALAAVRRLTDHLMTQVGEGKADIVLCGIYKGMPSCSVIIPVVRLYEITRDPRYLAFARYIVARGESAEGPQLIGKADVPVALRWPHPSKWYTKENGMKAYEMMSCYAGLLRLYQITHEEQLLNAAKTAAGHIMQEEINLAGSGSAFECWYGGSRLQTLPTAHTMETCVTVTWMQLCAELLRITKDTRYADEIERSAYNALLASMRADGRKTAKYSPLAGHRYEGELQCGLNINCCTANAARGFCLLPSVMYGGDYGEVDVNLYAPSTATVSIDGRHQVEMTQATDYPADGKVEIQVSPSHSQTFTVALRIPLWSRHTRVSVNGNDCGDIVPGQYCRIHRTWTKGDRIVLNLDMQGRLQENNHCQAITYGPVVLARDSRFQDGFVDEGVDIKANNGTVALQRTVAAGFARLTFTVSTITGTNREGVKPRAIHLCDFASAGNDWDDKQRYRVWLPKVIDVRTENVNEYI